MTLSDLADAVGSSPTRISQFQAGKELPSLELASALAGELRYPLEFFYGPELEPLDCDAVSFRSLSRLRARDRDAALASANVALLVARWMEVRYDLPAPAIPDHAGATPEQAAEAVRSTWGLGQGPIANTVHLLEAHGIRVFSLLEDCAEMDAFCFWDGNVPYVFLNVMKSGERSRFDAAHELGHLVLHRREPLSRNKEAEREANDFASAFLMPAAATAASLSGVITLSTALAVKRAWGVSVAAAAVRLNRLDLLSDWNYRSLFQQLSARGWRTKEPEGLPTERSRLLEMVLADMAEQGMSLNRLAEELRVPSGELRALTFSLAEAQTPARTTPSSVPPTPPTTSSKPALSLVDR